MINLAELFETYKAHLNSMTREEVLEMANQAACNSRESYLMEDTSTWIAIGNDEFICRECGKSVHEYTYKYCPHCGRFMTQSGMVVIGAIHVDLAACLDMTYEEMIKRGVRSAVESV